jgi:WD40 repeat protein
MRTLQGHTRDVRAVAYTPDGRLVSGGGADKTWRVWDVTTGKCTAKVKASGPVYAVAASPDGKTIAYGGRHASGATTNHVHLCDPDGQLLGKRDLLVEDTVHDHVPGGHQYQYQPVRRVVPRTVWSIGYSADGNYLAAVCRAQGGGNIPDGGGGRFWRLGETKWDGPLDPRAYAVAFAPAGSRCGVTRQNAVDFFAEPGGQLTGTCPVTVMWPPSVAFVPGRDVAVIASNAFIYFVNPVEYEKPLRLKTGLRTVVAVAASPDGKTVLVGGKPGTIEVYDAATRTKTTTYEFGIGGVHSIAYAPDGLTFAAGGDTGLVVCDSPG